MEQIVKYFEQGSLIHPYFLVGFSVVETYRDVLRPHGLLKVELEEVQFLHHIDLSVFQHPSILLNTHEIKQFLHETVEIIGVVPDDGEVVTQLIAEVAGSHYVLKRRTDEGQRGLYFVDYVVEESYLLLEKLLFPCDAFLFP